MSLVVFTIMSRPRSPSALTAYPQWISCQMTGVRQDMIPVAHLRFHLHRLPRSTAGYLAVHEEGVRFPYRSRLHCCSEIDRDQIRITELDQSRRRSRGHERVL